LWCWDVDWRFDWRLATAALLDRSLPDADGLDLVSELRARMPAYFGNGD
jgi:DNA-binding response OmpR family regulator